MKRLVFAAALAGLACTAQAQNSVTLYGLVDIGVINDKIDGQSSRTAIDQALYAPSRFGMRGTENLGNGLSAVFVLENGFSPDTGTLGNGGRLFGRDAYVGLQSKSWGAVRMGRTTNLGQRWAPNILSPFGLGFGVSAITSTFAFDDAAFGGGRADNAFYYETPNFGGFQVGAGYSFSTNGQEQPGTGNNNRLYDVSAKYSAGKFDAIVGYLYSKAADGTAPAGNPQSILAGASYDFGIVKAHAGYTRIRNAQAQASGSAIANTGWLTANRNDDNAYSVGLSAPVGGGRVMAAYQRLTSAKLSVYALGYMYELSKRTTLYAFIDQSETRNFNTGDDVDRRQVAAGISHRF